MHHGMKVGVSWNINQMYSLATPPSSGPSGQYSSLKQNPVRARSHAAGDLAACLTVSRMFCCICVSVVVSLECPAPFLMAAHVVSTKPPHRGTVAFSPPTTLLFIVNIPVFKSPLHQGFGL